MKVIITGATGFIGTEVLRQCLLHPSITSVVTLVRRLIPDLESVKLKQVIMKDDDFLTYPEHVMDEIRGAHACIWALGAVSFPTEEIKRRVSVDYVGAAGKAFASSAALSGQSMQVVLLSGALVVQDQSQTLYFLSDFRKLRGVGENKLIETVNNSNGDLTVVFARPAYVMAKGNTLASIIQGLGYSITVDQLAAALIDYAVKGHPGGKVENNELRLHGAKQL